VDAQSSQLTAGQAVPARGMRALLDARKLGDGGIGVYIENLAHGLIEAGGVEVTLLVRPGAEESATSLGPCSFIVDSSPCYSLDELFRLGRRIDWSRYDVFHTPHYVLPFGVKIPSVVTVHDLIHVEQPERPFYPLIAKRLICSSVGRAHATIAVSVATRQGVLGLTRAREEKVFHVPNAIAASLKPSSPALHLPAELQGVGSFFLSVFSNLKPHKALEDLLEAYGDFKSRGLWRQLSATCPRLVLAGYGVEGLSGRPNVLKRIEELGDCVVLGAVTRDELAALYAKAAAIVVASRTEGFCLPALEAQSLGTPVVCRPIPALQELVTERDVVAEDMSIPALRDALRRGLESSPKHGRTPIHKHLELYSPKRTAEQVKRVYERAIAMRGER